ncbi:50S ribosomal protein L23 [Pectinatus cerevisiiphilus]|uniref:Large ribosomal subunit protein uL23 n=1 Tax=Pectinatus cerevisiiphilus TaxID=86956 RepID=A0A4R3KAP2_9FIRM|nr:50S ribosomal protein L23 [Pectinatus cerevisiiphilus]TCS80013.1 LSU ribosomal protein L23P [Pectinatus cerevisiiphilus]
MDARDIIIKPLVTERSTDLMAQGKYVFKVDKRANKVEISKAVEEIFKVKVTDVNTINVTGKMKRMGRNIGKRADYKKAIVKLAAGETIEFFEA